MTARNPLDAGIPAFVDEAVDAVLDIGEKHGLPAALATITLAETLFVDLMLADPVAARALITATADEFQARRRGDEAAAVAAHELRHHHGHSLIAAYRQLAESLQAGFQCSSQHRGKGVLQ